jgi:hypothetical protein
MLVGIVAAEVTLQELGEVVNTGVPVFVVEVVLAGGTKEGEGGVVKVFETMEGHVAEDEGLPCFGGWLGFELGEDVVRDRDDGLSLVRVEFEQVFGVAGGLHDGILSASSHC